MSKPIPLHRGDPVAAAARLRQSLATMRAELAAIEEALATVEAAASHPLAEPTLLTVEETAQVLRVGKSTVFSLVSTGELASAKPGKCRLISRRSIDDYLVRIGAA